MTTALLDGDVYVYSASAVAEYEHDWGDGVWSIEAHEAEAIEALETSMQRDIELAGADEVIIALTDREHPNFRNTYWPEYKANRAGKRKPMLIPLLRDYLIKHYDVRVIPSLEGDDVLGILMTQPMQGDHHFVCVTIDKDLRTIPGDHLRIGEDEVFRVTEAEAWKFFLSQCLTGDQVDNFPGLRGFGPITVEKWFRKYGISWESVVLAYESKGLNEEDALVQARCARILHASDYDVQTNAVIPWEGGEC